MDEHAHEVAVADAPERSRFEITVDGELAGFAEYRLRSGRAVFTHTEIDDDQQGRGLAGRLAQAALGRVRGRGLQVIPLCPYIAAYIRRHPEYVELVDAAHRERVS
nr:GNAT family N-acetyltransferase [Pseudonocardia sp.]